jgi:hypothetical protein
MARTAAVALNNAERYAVSEEIRGRNSKRMLRERLEQRAEKN